MQAEPAPGYAEAGNRVVPRNAGDRESAALPDPPRYGCGASRERCCRWAAWAALDSQTVRGPHALVVHLPTLSGEAWP